MLLQPKKRKFRKQMVSPIRWKAKSWRYVAFGDFWLKAMQSWYVSNRQLEAARKVIIRRIKKIGKMWIRVFPHTPITKSWLEMPMGKWKWEVDKYCARVKRWKILFEVGWVNRELAEESLMSATYKLPIKCRFVVKWELR